MKTLPYIIATTFFLFSASLQAQVFQGELETVYLENTTVSLNDFESVNDEINNSEEFKFRKAIKKARRQADTLVFQNDDRTLEMTEEAYLKTLRRTANQSKDSTEFVSKLVTEMPELKETITENDAYKDLYTTVRPDTFNGKIDALPDVL